MEIKKDDDDEAEGKPNHRSPSPDVKSTAVVKYSSVRCPIGYSKLQCDTDLKMPPSNWLSSATDSYGLQHALGHPAVFSSFRMAHMFPDCVGEVDVVSGAECIKSLLKLPYHPDGVVSMIVHRVENTLLLDEFDIYQYLMKSEWSWMKKFFYEKFLKSISVRDRVTFAKNKSRYALQQKSLVSKFLYHSLPSSKAPESEDDEKRLRAPSLPSPGPSLPEPDIRKTLPTFSDHTYNRNVVWTFENLQMLIGTDMPIFGGADRPCVSLRLRDATQPINVLTGIDYWLDNLMCNVPEVIMCYHLEGMVRKYEPIKTEDLPNLKDSKFSPKVIRNVAQNILSFLKSNATKAGHTYWLFKGTNDDVVKLYDLSTLCGTNDSSADRNPFTVPVAMLLYRVARNMKSPCQSGHIKTLLENCIKLLPIEKYPHIVASSHFMLANLFVPTSIDPISPNFKTNGECECGDPSTCRRQESYDDDTNLDGVNFNNEANSEPDFDNDGNSDSDPNQSTNEKLISGDVAVRTLSAPSNPFFTLTSPPPTVSGKLEERCKSALKYVIDGLSALKFYTSGSGKDRKDETNTHKKYNEEDNPKMAKSNEPIPMGYKTMAEENQLMAQPNVPISLPYKDDKSNNNISQIENVKSERSSRRKKRDGKNKKTSENGNSLPNDVENLRQKMDGIVLRKENAVPILKEPSSADDISWKIHLKLLLYEKACLSCLTLAEQYFSDGQFGTSYKTFGIAQKCKRLLNSILNNSVLDDSCLLKRAGDNLFTFAKYWDKYTSDYLPQMESFTIDEKYLLEEIESDMKLYANGDKVSEEFADFTLPTEQEDAIVKSIDFYTRALKYASKSSKDELLRKIASGKNELGVKYMYNAQEQFTLHCNSEGEKSKSKKKSEPLYETLSKRSLTYLTESAKIFEQVNDVPNLALLHCNTGRFMRFRAHCNKLTHSPEQRRLYASAVEHYGTALRLLSGGDCENIRSLVQWELSSALFTQACLLQDSPPDIPDPAKEAAEALRVALRNCPLMEGPRQCLYQFRAGVLHHRLASLYHNQVRDPHMEAPKVKAAAALSKVNYEMAVKLFLQLDDTTMFLTVQLEHIALTEFQANNCPGLKYKYLENALDLLLKCEPILKIVSEKEVSTSQKSTNTVELENDKNSNSDSSESEHKLLVILQQRLQYILKNLVQICTQKSASWRKENEDIIAFYKNAYGLTLKSVCSDNVEHKDFARKLHDILVNINNMPH